MRTIRLLGAVVISSSLLGACSKKGEGPESETANDVTTTTPETTVIAEPIPPPLPATPVMPAEPPLTAEVTDAEPAPPPLTDPQIVMVLEVVNTAEVDQGKLAQKKAKHPQVKKFAQQMVQQHTKAKQKGATLAKKGGMTPEESLVAEQLTARAKAQTEALQTVAPPEFDASYIHGQLMQHEEVLNVINEQLLPGVSDEALKSHLEEAKAMIEAHIAQAKEVEQALGVRAGDAGNDAGA